MRPDLYPKSESGIEGKPFNRSQAPFERLAGSEAVQLFLEKGRAQQTPISCSTIGMLAQ